MTTVKLQSVEQINDTTYTFWFEPNQPIEYTAGQFIELFIPHDADERGTHRWFTLSSSPTEKLLAITTRKATRPSTFKKLLFALQPGETIQMSQAMGDFVLPMQKSVPIIFLIRGIGITPVRSILTCVQDNHEKRSISVVYSARQSNDYMFMDLLNDTVTKTDTYENSRNDDPDEPTQVVINDMKKAPNTQLYVSGPEQFVEKAYKQLRDAGIKNTAIVTDYFHGYEA
jgi:ferredoxin-NADP reductase